MGQKLQSSRWIIVSNRLPVTVSKSKDKLIPSTGGLVTAIRSIRDSESAGSRSSGSIWVGCAPTSPGQWNQLERSYTGRELLKPVFVPPDVYNGYYNGLCNDLLWPLMHYEIQRTQFRQSDWQHYQAVNQAIADVVLEVVEPDDLIWIHDFHLFLLPRLLKKKNKNLRIGFFLHIPFPSSEIFRQLPIRREILDGLLSSDLVGFQDYSYLRHFCSSILRILGIESSFLSLIYENRRVKLGVYPVSIDPERTASRAASPRVIQRMGPYQDHCFRILGVDRLDYIKGLILKLKAYQSFLTRYPEVQGKVRLIQIAVPTRTQVPQYQQLKQAIDELVGNINGAFATPTWSPITYIYSSVEPEELLALYRSSQALLVTSRRDGLNLVSLEYLAAQDPHDPGVIVLSEFTGAMSILSQTLRINPWDSDSTADTLKLAFDIPREERIRRWKPMMEYLSGYTASHWASVFLTQLVSASRLPAQTAELIADPRDKIQRLVDKIRALGRRNLTFIVDYDGTLVPISERPERALIDPATLKGLSQIIARGHDLMVVSGRPSDFLQSQLSTLHCTLVAEHGTKIYSPLTEKWSDRIHFLTNDWYPLALQIMRDYSKRVPGSFVEQKNSSIAWHYRQAPSEYGYFQALKLHEELEIGLANFPVNILSGKKIIEVRHYEANKGLFAAHYFESSLDSAAIALGDDTTDEDLFLAIRPHGISVKVGTEGNTKADFILPDQHNVIELMTELSLAMAAK